MFRKIAIFFRSFFNKSSTVKNEPLNKISLIVIIAIDIFILVNVFTGLEDISGWYLSPQQAYPCYSEWQEYQTNKNSDKDLKILSLIVQEKNNQSITYTQDYQSYQNDHLGTVSPVCLTYAEYKDKINNSQNQELIEKIENTRSRIDSLEQSNSQIREEYDSTLLEKIAGQSRARSINQVAVENAKQELEKNLASINKYQQETSQLQQQLITETTNKKFIEFIQNSNQFKQLESSYQQASFWYPTIQFLFQSLFLLPLIAIAATIHQFTQSRGYGLVSLISWHLLVIFFVPLLLKLYIFLQLDVVFNFLFNIITAIFGGLVFLVSYLYIFLIPLIGFGLIKFFQKIVFNPKLQIMGRVQKSLCINCTKKIRSQDIYCPYCGQNQCLECQHCHELTYQHLPYCKHCGKNL